MKEERLNDIENAEFQELVVFADNIKLMYNTLMKMEITGDKGSERYNKSLLTLQNLINEEQDYIKNNLQNTFKIDKFLRYIMNEEDIDTLLAEETLIAKQDYRKIYKQRIINHLVKKEFSIIDYAHVFLNDDERLAEIDELYGIDKARLIKIKDSLDNEYKHIFVDVLNQSIKTSKEAKEKLIETKYRFAYINPEIEAEMLASKFNGLFTVYLDTERSAEYFDIDIDSYEYTKSQYGVDKAVEHISYTMELENGDYVEEKNKVNSLIRTHFIRAALAMTDEYYLNELNFNVQNIFEKLGHEYDMSKKIVTNTLEKTFMDKEKIKKLTM